MSLLLLRVSFLGASCFIHSEEIQIWKSVSPSLAWTICLSLYREIWFKKFILLCWTEDVWLMNQFQSRGLMWKSKPRCLVFVVKLHHFQAELKCTNKPDSVIFLTLWNIEHFPTIYNIQLWKLFSLFLRRFSHVTVWDCSDLQGMIDFID